jgi:TRAP-type C4-dicarboxylate transport system permease small subunit
MSRDLQDDTGERQLRRLETFLDVSYALLFVQFIDYLPRTEDMAWASMPYGLLSLLMDNWVELLRLFIAVGLTLFSWNLTNKLLAPLQRTDATHTFLMLLHLILVCLFLFFAISDPMLVTLSSPVGQSLCLAASGFVGIGAWQYALRQGFTRASLSDAKKDQVARQTVIEPLTALTNTGFAFIGPMTWTVGWLVIPVVLITGRHRWERRTQRSPEDTPSDS